MRIAFIGSRGVPARYSGVETCVEELGARLVERGHEVTVYGRRHCRATDSPMYRGMRLIHVPGIASKHLDTISHTFTACMHALFQRYDVVAMSIAGNSPLAILARIRGAKVVLNIDSSDWRRKKWGRFARAYLRWSERLALRLAHCTITDSPMVQRDVRERLGAQTECIDYGAEVPAPTDTSILAQLGLTSRGYLLLVGRLVPENCAHHLVDAYEHLHTDLKCVVVGDAPYARRYISDLKRRGPHVIFPGYVFGEGYRALLHNAYAVAMCSEVGGTHPVLVEAMAAGNCVVVNDIPANLHVVDDAGLSYDGRRGADALREVLETLLAEDETAERYRGLAAARARSAYSWQRVADQYEGLFVRLLGVTDTPIAPARPVTEPGRGQ